MVTTLLLQILARARLLSGLSFSQSLQYAVLPIAKVLIICGMGFLMSTRRVNVLPPTGTKLLSKLVFALFLPCLLFTELGAAITFQKLLQWWFIPVNVVLAYAIGCFIGLMVVLVVQPPQEFRRFTIVMIGAGNIGNIPLVIIGAMCADDSSPFGDSDTCNEDGVAYIAFGQWVGAVLVYTCVYSLLSPRENPKLEEESQDSLTVPLFADEESYQDETKNALGDISWWKAKVSNIASALKLDTLKYVLQPPIIASILALAIGCIPTLKNLLLTDDAPLSFLSDSLGILGEAMIPCVMVSLGGNLVGGPGSSKLGPRTTIAITFSRLFLIPPVGMGVVALADRLGFLPENDPLFRFVLLLQHTMPTSLLTGALTALRGVAEKEASAVLFWEHIFAVVSITGWLILYLNLLF